MKEVYEGIVSFLKNYQERTHVKGYVLGISGGKTSVIFEGSQGVLLDLILDFHMNILPHFHVVHRGTISHSF